MNLFTGLLNYAVTLSILDVSPVLLGVFAVIALAIAIILLVVRPTITYVDTEGDQEIHKESHPLLKKVALHGAAKNGKKLIGWSKVLGNSTPITKSSLRLFHSTVLYTIWEDVEYNSAVCIEFNYMDADEDKTVKKEVFALNTKLPDEQDDGLEIEGWSFSPDEAPVLTKEDVEAVFVVNLYPIFEESPVSGANVPVNNKATVDILFTDGETEKKIYKESHYLSLSLPKEYEQYDNFLGWGFAKDGDIILDKTDAESIFTIQLFSKPELVEEAPKAEEPIVVVPEVVEEVAPEVIEEVIEEVVEEPAPEVVEEVIEEVVEEPAPEVVEEAVEEVAPEVVEEAVEEPAPEVVEEAVEEPAPEVVEEAIEEPAPEVVEEPAKEEAPASEVEAVIVPTYFDNEGNKIDIKLSRSITANIIQSDDTVKSYYSELKNHILSYKGVKSRISWKFDSYNRGRDQLFKIKLRGKTICLYCALNPDEFDKAKYHHEAIDAKVFADVPMLVKVKSGLGLRKAKELVDIEMANLGIEKNPKAKENDYVAQYPYEENEPLIERGLIKILVSDDSVVKKSTKPVQEEVVEEPIVEVAPEVVEEVAPEVIEEVVPEVVEEPTPEVVEEVIEEVVEEPAPEVVEEVIEEVVEEVAPEVVEEVIEEVVEEPAPEVIEEVIEEEEEVYEEHVVIVEEVSAEDADQIAEEQHIDIHVEEGVEYVSAKDTKKAIVNVDTLSDAFEAHDIVNLAAMKEKKLIDKRAKTVKVLARGSLNKPLIVKAGDFSKTAIEMILLTGGNAVHVTYKIKK